MVELAARSPALEAVARGEAEQARAAALEATRLANPELGYSREQVFGGGGAAEDSVTLSQSLPLSGARGLRRRAGEVRARAAGLAAELARARLVGRARLLFFEALHASLRAEAFGAWTGRLEAALASVAARERSGDAAAFERARLERELSRARSSAASEGAAGRRLRGELGGLLGLEDGRFARAGRVEGSLGPEAPLPPLEALLAELDRRPDLLAFEEQVEAARLEERAAARGWVPSLSLQGGYRTAEQDGGRAHGYLAGLALSVPLFDRDQAERRRAAAAARAAGGRRELLLARARGEVVGLHGEAAALADSARGFRGESEAARAGLVRSVEAAYRGDEASLLELLDVHRGVLEDELRILELDWSARRARVELDLALGRVQP